MPVPRPRSAMRKIREVLRLSLAEGRTPTSWIRPAQQPDALVLVPTDPVAMQASVDQAIAQGIPVICVDTTVNDQSKLTAFITGDNKDGGAKAADELAKQIGEKGKIFIMASSPTTTTNVQRGEGFKAEIAKFPNIQIVGEDYSGSQPAKATSIINTILLKYPDL